MKKFILSVLLAAASISAFAVNTDGLTEVQRREIEQSIQKLKSENSGTAVGVSASIRNEVKAWSDIGTGVGQAMVAAAKELGVAATTFAETPLGKITVGIVVFNVIGASIAKMFIGIMALVVGIGVAIFSYRGYVKSAYDIKYETVPAMFGLLTKRVISSQVKSGRENDGMLVMTYVWMAAGFLVFTICFANV